MIASLVQEVAARLAVPRAEPADSFVLHAPLELLARRRLLDWVADVDRSTAEKHTAHHVAAIGEAWDACSAPAPAAEWPDVADLDVAGLAPAIAARTGAAAHAPIFLASIRAEAQLGNDTAGLWPMLGPLVRELDRHPDWRISWSDRTPPTGPGDPAALADVLADPPRLGRGESTFIHPMIDRAERVAAERLAPVLPADGDPAVWTPVILRTATASMLLDDPERAPYGWTHCLTLPLAVLQLADLIGPPAIWVAATHVHALRCSLAATPVVPDQVADLARPAGDLDRRVADLALAATRRHDAHVVKYSLAVIDAASLDPDASDLYLAAGERLLEWWDERGDGALDT